MVCCMTSSNCICSATSGYIVGCLPVSFLSASLFSVHAIPCSPLIWDEEIGVSNEIDSEWYQYRSIVVRCTRTRPGRECIARGLRRSGMGERTAKDGAKFLKLCSPAGAPPALYNWPLVNNVSGPSLSSYSVSYHWPRCVLARRGRRQ